MAKKKLEKLTQEQEKLMKEVANEWISYFNSLSFDEEKAKHHIEYLYKLIGFKKPEIIICDSSLGCQIGSNILNSLFENINNKNDETIYKLGNQVRNQVWNQVANQVLNQVRNQVENQVENQVRNQVENQVENQVWNQVWNQVANQVWNQVANQVLNQVRNQVGNQVGNQVRNQVGNQVKNQVVNQVWNQVGNQVGNQVLNQVRNQVGNQLRNQVGNQVKNSLKIIYNDIFYYGDCWDYSWISFYDFFKRIGIVKNKEFDTYSENIKCNILYIIGFENYCFISRPPLYIHRDEQGRMHDMSDYAIRFGDGYGQCYVHGVYFDDETFNKFFIEKKYKSKDILKIKNTEQKAILIQHIGYEKVLNDLKNVVVLDEDSQDSCVTGKPCVCQVLEYEIDDGIVLRVVRVEDHSVHKVTFLGVPREENTKTVKGAVAWTFGLESNDYEPLIQT